MQTEKQIQGQQGEQIASEYLFAKGYTILEKNWRRGHLEVDLIASNGDLLIFVEVKTRKSNAFGEPEDFVGIQKQRNLFRAAGIYLNQTSSTKEVRFDIISVLRNESTEQIRHIEGAFKPQW